MRHENARNAQLLIADPDAERRRRILSGLGSVRAIEAASMSEAFDLTESAQPGAIAMSTRLSGDTGLEMFLHLVDALSVPFAMYGRPGEDQIPTKFRKSVTFIDLGERRGLTRLAQLLDTTHSPARRANDDSALPLQRSPSQPKLIVIGASTGGVSALEEVLTAFPSNCPPTLVVQHIRPGFIEGMIRRLNQRCSPEVISAGDSVRPGKGQILIAADTERHLVVQNGDPLRCRLKPGPSRHGHRPSVDALFESAAGRSGVAAALLTGMGADGADGMRRIKDAGGHTIAQDEESCVVYGMPRVAVETGAASIVLPLEQIANGLLGGERAAATPRLATSVR